LRIADCGLPIDGLLIADWDWGLLIYWGINPQSTTIHNQQSQSAINNPSIGNPQSAVRNRLY
jgi:hypothetical protein